MTQWLPRINQRLHAVAQKDVPSHTQPSFSSASYRFTFNLACPHVPVIDDALPAATLSVFSAESSALLMHDCWLEIHLEFNLNFSTHLYNNSLSFVINQRPHRKGVWGIGIHLNTGDFQDVTFYGMTNICRRFLRL